MASKLTKINDKSMIVAYREFLCDTVEDIAKLPREGVVGTIEVDEMDIDTNDPCSIGSMAYVCTDKAFYILAPNNEWVIYE